MSEFVKGNPELVADYRMRADRFYGMDGDGMQAPGAIVIAFLRSNKNHPYVVWFANTQSGGTHNGDYCKTLKEAEEAFNVKCTRYDPTGRLNAAFNARA
jgi:hypothetical protein